MNKIKKIIDQLDREYSLVSPPASDEQIERVNRALRDLEIGELPSGLAKFFGICGGLERNGMVIYGTHYDKIISHNEDRHDYYEDFPHLLFFGSIDDDIYVYNTQSQQYESRDINGMESWEEYDSFEEFFFGEMVHWLG